MTGREEKVDKNSFFCIETIFIYKLRLCVQELNRRWTSILFHVCGIHRWEDGGQEYKCYHDDLSADQQRRKKWLQKDSAAYNALKAIVLDKTLLRDLDHMTLFKHTGKMESVH